MRKYQRRRKSEDLRQNPTTRICVSLPMEDAVAIKKIAEIRRMTVSWLFAQSVLRDEKSSVTRFSLEDFEFMISILKVVGTPLTLEELLSLLQKHKSMEVTNG